MKYLMRHTLLLSLLVSLFMLAGCGSDSSPTPSYTATIAEGRSAVREVMDETSATAISVALTDGDRIIWSESFGVTDKATGKINTPETMIGIGSVSKMFATVAAMILVDQGKIALDEPLVTYLPDFAMQSPEYRDITVRMLLNHSSGFPGTDYRNSETVILYPGYATQIMEGLKKQRLKHSPGYLSVYCNDGFTMIENLVKTVTGKSYPKFVRQEILTPLGMTNSRYAVESFLDGSFARTHTGDTPNSYTFFNVYASGGLYSTAEDMARLAGMLMNRGSYGSKRILSERSVAKMAQDQTLSSFNPLPSDGYRYGLGWDSVVQPGLNLVGVRGWSKGGDIAGYGATMVVAPDERLAVTVLGASNGMGSGKATVIAERIMLRALVERGRLAAMPVKLDKSKALPVQSPTGDEKTSYSGFYASDSAQFRVSFQPDNSLDTAVLSNGSWQPTLRNLKLRTDGWYAADNDSIKAVRFLTRTGRTYLALRQLSGSGFYRAEVLLAQKLDTGGSLSVAWQSRLAETWLPVNDDLYSASPEIDMDPRLKTSTSSDLPGYFFAGTTTLREMTPQSDKLLDGMILLIPQGNGRDLMDLAVETWEGQQWLRFGSAIYRPLSGVAQVPAGQTTVTIGSEGFAEWRSLPATGSLTISGATAWKVLNPDFTRIASGKTSGSVVLSGGGSKYLLLYGAKGATIGLNLTTP